MKRVLFCICAYFYLTGCASSLSGDTYSRKDARQEMQVFNGTIQSVRPVVIQGEAGLLGQIGGALIGGLAGNAIGGGKGKNLATGAGAVGGAVAGGALEQKLTSAQGLEIIVKLENGQTRAITQQVKTVNEFYAGERVRLIVGGGNTRVEKAQ